MVLAKAMNVMLRMSGLDIGVKSKSDPRGAYIGECWLGGGWDGHYYSSLMGQEQVY